MDYLKAIDQRVSSRIYDGQPINENKQKEILYEIEKCNKEYGLTISFIEDGSEAFDSFGKSYGLFKGVRSLIMLKGPTENPNLDESIGYSGEKIILLATSLGLGTCWVGGTFERNNPMFSVADGERLICVIPIGNILDKKPLLNRVMKLVMRRKPLDSFYTTDATLPDWFQSGVEAAQKAPTARNSQKVHFTYKNGITTVSVPETYKLDFVDLGIVKLHFELGAEGSFPLGNNVEFTRSK